MLNYLSCTTKHGEDLCKTLPEALCPGCLYIRFESLLRYEDTAQEVKLIIDAEENFISMYSMCTDGDCFLEVESTHQNCTSVVSELISAAIDDLLVENNHSSASEDAHVSVRVENILNEVATMTVSANSMLNLMDRAGVIGAGSIFPMIGTSSGVLFPAFPLHMPDVINHISIETADCVGNPIFTEEFMSLTDVVSYFSTETKEASLHTRKGDRSYSIIIHGNTDDIVHFSFCNNPRGITVMTTLLAFFKKHITD